MAIHGKREGWHVLFRRRDGCRKHAEPTSQEPCSGPVERKTVTASRSGFGAEPPGTGLSAFGEKIALACAEPASYIRQMNCPARSASEVLEVLRAHEPDLRAWGVETLILFGSMARGDITSASDADLAMRPGAGFSAGGFDHFGQLEALRDRLMAVLGCEVDLVEENAARPRLRQVIDKEGVRAF